MEIRKVQTKDISQIKKLADSLVVTSKDADKKFGFYDYSLSEEQYRKRSESDLFFVGCGDSELGGFCMAYDSDFVKQLIEQEPQLRDDAVFNYFVKQREDFIYIDQLAVRKPKTFIGGAYACRLFERLKENSEGNQSIQGVIPHLPWKNETSIRSVTNQGARLLKEITGKNQIVFGVYRLDLV
ncbi:hypothetical protein HYT23_04155 [Candidatus Pacearchaeota archaeon]|nr:hypothetical protein [Candidatus Pacearchaeota archaeon]